mgnify:CR=1 FL=1
MQKVFITRHIPDVGLAMLRKKKSLHVVVSPQDHAISRRKLLRGVRGADILLSILTDHIDAQVMDAAGPQLKMIANYAVGFDNIDLKAAKARGITVTNTPGPEISEAVAEHVIALIFALAHRVAETDAFARKGKYRGWGPEMLLGTDVYGSTVGIIGGGAIGTAVARRMRDGFDVKILYHDIKRNPELEVTTGAKFCTLPQLLKKSDVVSLHVPLLPSTRHMIGRKELAAMKPSAFLINTSRGPIIDEVALIDALQRNVIVGAGIDVYEHEPSIPRALRKLRNAVLTPHTASATHGARNAMSRVAAANILAFIAGKQPPNVVR